MIKVTLARNKMLGAISITTDKQNYLNAGMLLSNTAFCLILLTSFPKTLEINAFPSNASCREQIAKRKW